MWLKLCYFSTQDDVIYERLAAEQSFADSTQTHLHDFAGLGLRTLCLAWAELTEDFYQSWKHTYYKASTAIVHRETKLEEAAEIVEVVSTFISQSYVIFCAFQGSI